MQQEISSQARGEMDRSQREYYLRQQLRAIQHELGEGEEMSEELAGFRKTIVEKKIAPEAAAWRSRSRSSGSSGATRTPPRRRSSARTSTG